MSVRESLYELWISPYQYIYLLALSFKILQGSVLSVVEKPSQVGYIYILQLQISYSVYMLKITKIGWQYTKLLQK